MHKIGLKKAILFVGDLVIFFASLYLALFIRYGVWFFIGISWQSHVAPFIWIYAIWTAVFFSAGLYDWEKFTPSRRYYTAKLVYNSMLVNFALAIFLFYTVPVFTITPKTILIIDAILVMFLSWGWRTLFLKIISEGEKIRIIFLGSNQETDNFVDFLSRNPSLGYKVEKVEAFSQISGEKQIDLIVVEPKALENKELVKNLYNILPSGISIINFPKFYEHVTGKIPTSTITESWFLENLMELRPRPQETAKRATDIILSALLTLVLAIVLPLAALLIKFESRGKVFFTQSRVGKNGKIFNLIKFRSMVEGAEYLGGLKESNSGAIDARLTRVGKILRQTYIDELPQALNVLRGEMSFVGPRPERPEYVKGLNEKVPFYETRLLVKPGITGWAQISMKNDASVEDAPEKMQYDLYYIKNRTWFLDFAIMLKTANLLLRRSGK